jgi:hypothetical protein
MATNNLKTLLDEAKVHPGTFSTRTHLSRHTIEALYAGKRTAAPKTQGSIVKALNSLLKKELSVEEVFPPKKQQKSVRSQRAAQAANA